EDRMVQKGETVKVGYYANYFDEVYGYQFTTDLNGLEVVQVESGVLEMTEQNIGLPRNGKMTMSWVTGEGVSASSSDQLFTVTYQATQEGMLSRMIEMSSSITNAEAYKGSDIHIANTELAIRGENLETFELFQN